MNLSSALGLRTKIALPFAITTIALVIIGLFSVRTAQNLVADTDNIADRFLPAVSEVLNGDRDLYQALVAQMALIEAASAGEPTNGLAGDFDENVQQARDRMGEAARRLAGTGVSTILTGYDAAFERWEQSARSTMALASDGNAEDARARMQTGGATQFSTLRDYFDKVGLHADELAHGRAREASSEGQTSSVVILSITAVAVILSVALFLAFMKMIIRSIGVLREQLDNIAQGEGDLTRRIPVENDDDLGQLATSFNQVLANLQTMIGAIQQLSNKLDDGAQELATAARDNNNGISKQTDSISMVATAVNEMQSAIEEVAGNASRAAEITRSAQEKGNNSATIIRNSSEQVRRLAAQINKAVEVIRKLAQNSENITSVLDVIRGVADQTNLLALNAAIEAARAGEQGRGFAVVADEVRTLAQRTQQSTEDIQAMISTLQSGVADIVSVMETGSKDAVETEKLATEAESELNGILAAMADISDMNISVASATEEQTQVVDEINRSVTEINDLAAESARRSEGIDSISKSLAGYADELKGQTGRFRV
ncbi:MAG: methyl-accepting chemotaxis protein [Marinobacter sp.]|nr:methyl-accepting chemotaxis protein [Marinobacter sp.]